MKHVPRLRAEPPSLATYRANNPADAVAPRDEAARVWRAFRDDPAYKDLREQLIALQQGLCGYCEQRLTSSKGILNLLDQQIEHVLPKSEGSGRTLDWSNLMLCCSGGVRTKGVTGRTTMYCGQSKDNKELGPNCDPRTFPCALKLVDVAPDGKLLANEPACGEVGINHRELQLTIDEVLNLNCDQLKFARSKVIDNLLKVQQSLVMDLSNNNGPNAQVDAAFRQMAADRLQPDACGHLRAFWSTERQCLGRWSSEWISQNEHLLYGVSPVGVRGAS